MIISVTGLYGGGDNFVNIYLKQNISPLKKELT